MAPAIKVENISKRYRLGLTHAGSIRELVNNSVRRFTRRSPGGQAVSPIDPIRFDADRYFWALRDVYFEIQPGEVAGIIGRNGAGKSTLLKILSRVTSPTSGRVEMRGRVASLLEVGTGFHPELTGRENVYMNGTILGMTRREISAQLDAIVDFSGVEAFIDTPVKRYSSGMTVRLGFAVAAHLEPEILIVDEVLAVGDAQFQKRCMGKLDDVAKSGRTVLFVSHSMAAIRQLTSHCVVMEDGRAAFLGDTASALERYLGNSRERAADPSAIASTKRSSWAGDQSIRFVYAANQNPSVGSEGDIHLRLGVSASVAKDFRLGITLHGPDGEAVASGFGPITTSIPGSSQQTFELEIRNPRLAPGRYWFTLGILHRDRELLDVVQEILHFEVTSQDSLPSGINEWNPSWGQTQLKVKQRSKTSHRK